MLKRSKCIKILYIILILNLIFMNNIVYADDYEEDYSYNTVIFDENDLEVSVEPTKEPVINSRAAIIIDRKTGLVLYEKNSNDIRKMASTTKIMTAIVVIENTSNFYETVTISKKAASIGGSILGLRANDKITINDLLYGIMLKSGNDAAIALAETVGGSVEGFAEMMNKKAFELGLENTHFITPHGLDNEDHYTTAFELAKLTNYALDNKKFKEIVNTKSYTVNINSRPVGINNSNELLGNYIGVYGVKTGFTNGANRCLVTACQREGIDIISVVLGADTKLHRTKDSMNILTYIYKNYKNINIEQEIEKSFKNWLDDNFIEVEKGVKNYLELRLDNIKYTLIPIDKNKMDKLQISIKCETSIKAPIYMNTKVGEIVVKIDDTEILTTDILVKQTVKNKETFDYLKDFLQNFKTYMLETSI